MEIEVYRCGDRKIVGIIYLSSGGWKELRVLEGGEGLRDAFRKCKLLNPIEQNWHGSESHAIYIRKVAFGHRSYLRALDETISNYGDFMLFWDKKTYERLRSEYERFIETIKEGQKAA